MTTETNKKQLPTVKLQRSKQVRTVAIDNIPEEFVSDDNGTIIIDDSQDCGYRRRWAFTMFNYETKDIEYIRNGMKGVKYIIFGEEVCPTTQRKHLQGYVVFTSAVTRRTVKKRFNHQVWCKPAYASEEANIKYCSKSGIVHEEGTPLHQGKDTELFHCVESLKTTDLESTALKHPTAFVNHHTGLKQLKAIMLKQNACKFRHIETFIIWGEPGAGKSKSVRETHGEENIYSLQPPNSKTGALWFNGYNEEKVLLIDEFYGWIPFSFLLKLLDGYRLQLQTKGGDTYALWNTVYIVSNKPPHTWYTSIDAKWLAAFTRRINGTQYMGSEEYRLKALKPSNKLSIVESDLNDRVED